MRVGVEVGGTFTDLVAVEGGKVVVTKVPSTPRSPDIGAFAALTASGIDLARIEDLGHGSTVATNAVLERKGAAVAFVATAGFRDLLFMQRHDRRNIYDLFYAKPAPPVRRKDCFEAPERLQADGSIEKPLDEAAVKGALIPALKAGGYRAVAICLLNAYANPVHEKRLAALLGEALPDVLVTASHQVAREFREFERASTTLLSAYVQPVIDGYLHRFESKLAESGFKGRFTVMQSNGGRLPAEAMRESAITALYSGPAAGVVGATRQAARSDFDDLITFDMGGTSTDVCLVQDGRPSLASESEIDGLPIRTPVLDIVSVGAGGGSIAWVDDGGMLRVGPQSAGADPGPACYGKGGTQPATTDTALLMGIIDPGGFAGGRMHLDENLARQAFENLVSTLSFDQRVNYAFKVGVNNIAEGLFNVAVKHGIDPRDFTLLAFGAAGPMLLPAALDVVHAKEVVVPPHPGLFSALGLVSSDQVYGDSRSAYTILEPGAAESIKKVYGQMEDRLRERFGDRADDVNFVRTFDALLVGQSWETPFVGIPDGEITAEVVDQMIANFHDVYEQRTGNRFEALPVQGVTYRVEAVIPADKVEYPVLPTRESGGPEPTKQIQIRYLAAEPLDANEYQRLDLRAGDEIAGPAVIREPLSTTFVPPDHRAVVGTYGELHISSAK
jgi:N-methylhydantoinase A